MDTQTIQRKYAADYEGNPPREELVEAVVDPETGEVMEAITTEKSLSAEEYLKMAFMWAKSHPKISIAVIIVLLFVFHIL